MGQADDAPPEAKRCWAMAGSAPSTTSPLAPAASAWALASCGVSSVTRGPSAAAAEGGGRGRVLLLAMYSRARSNAALYSLPCRARAWRGVSVCLLG